MTSDNVHTPVRYPSDLSDEEWAIIEQVLNELDPYKTGRRRDSNLREILNAIFYLNKTGCLGCSIWPSSHTFRSRRSTCSAWIDGGCKALIYSLI
jgi:hypothetical protein